MIKYFKDIDILNIELHKGEFGYSEEIADGVIFDISQGGEILSIEVLDVAKKFHKPGCGSGFSRSMWQEHPDDGLNRAPGFALQFAASRSSRPVVGQPSVAGLSHTHRPITYTPESPLLSVPSNLDTSSQ